LFGNAFSQENTAEINELDGENIGAEISLLDDTDPIFLQTESKS